MQSIDLNLTELQSNAIDETLERLRPIVAELEKLKVLRDVLMQLTPAKVPDAPVVTTEIPRKKNLSFDHAATRGAIMAYVRTHPGCTTSSIMRYMRAVKVLPLGTHDDALRSLINRDVKAIGAISWTRSQGPGAECTYSLKQEKNVQKPGKVRSPNRRPPYQEGIRAFILQWLQAHQEATPVQVRDAALEAKIPFPPSDLPSNIVARILRNLMTQGTVTRRGTGMGLIYSMKAGRPTVEPKASDSMKGKPFIQVIKNDEA